RVPTAIAPERNGDGRLGAAAAAVDASAPVDVRTARVGYLIPWNTAAAAALVELQATGIRVHAAGAQVRLQGRRFEVGTLFIRNAELDATSDARDVLGRIAGRHGAELVPVDSAFVDEGGISLGSNQMRALPAKRVVLLWDEPA